MYLYISLPGVKRIRILLLNPFSQFLLPVFFLLALVVEPLVQLYIYRCSFYFFIFLVFLCFI